MTTSTASLPDRRTHAYRDDLADAALKGRLEAAHFVEGKPYRVKAATAPQLQKAEPGSRWDSELLHGEAVSVFEIRDGFAWCQCASDRYVGYVATEHLAPAVEMTQPTHLVRAIRAPVFPEPDLKTPTIGWRSIGSRVTLAGESRNRFEALTGGGWLYNRHVVPLDAVEPDYAAFALRFLELPYIWGGRSGAGLDCSALVQLSMLFAGYRDVPRDSDQQRAGVGEALPPDAPRQRGDLAFFPGHVGIMLDAEMMVHANATNMAVTINAAEEVAGWTLKSDGAGITGINRIA